MMREVDPESNSLFEQFADPRVRDLFDLHLWTMREGLRGASAKEMFLEYCRRLVARGMSLSRGHMSTRTLHPQWRGYGYSWQRDQDIVQSRHLARKDSADDWIGTPFHAVVTRAFEGEGNSIVRKLIHDKMSSEDLATTLEFHGEGATEFLSTVYTFGEHGDPAHGTGVVYSFATDRPGGFSNTELLLLRTTLPGLSLAMKAHAGYEIASGLLRTYLGEDAGKRVHSGAVERGSVQRLRAVIWYADIRGFTKTSDSNEGELVIEMLDDTFEALASVLRPQGGQVLKFIGDAMLAIFACDARDASAGCRRALQAAGEAQQKLAELSAARLAKGLAAVEVDIALHVGEVLYGNIGAADRLDFTVIGPAVNEAARIEKLCEPLNRRILTSATFAEASGEISGLLEPVGAFELRGVSGLKVIYGLRDDSKLSSQPAETAGQGL